jgi:hypothetical protein
MPAEPKGSFGYWHDPVFAISLAIYAINRLLIKPHLREYSWFFHGHLNDTLTVPVALPLYLFAYRWIGFRPDDEPPRWWEVALHVAVWNVFFEWFGPVVMHQGVYDPQDFACITFGGIMAWILWHYGPRRRAQVRFSEP